ncbi:Hydroxyacylglutathione hydrolase, mitochondrial [Orchesella cincta]|uniref:hydroxyacylglutathione hydrolase n=1 Tax=Orchesella cincta TaxID=48709 RepID=A0A1D2MWP1_ORCCI|nr:Hydroxyacylglutathione hydrolase, mitochondrial [Orchesella cincta]
MSTLTLLRSRPAAWKTLEVFGLLGVYNGITKLNTKYRIVTSPAKNFHKGFCSVNQNRPDSAFKTSSSFEKFKNAAISWGFNVYRAFASGGKMHSEKCVVDFPNLRIIGIPALSDNFMYLVIDKNTMQAVAFDPVEPNNVLDEIRKQNVTLSAILTTHHHWDHANGNEEMVSNYKKEVLDASIEVYGGDDRIQALTKKIGQGDTINVGSMTFQCLFTPCHTTGHICYFLTTQDSNIQKPAVFTGDTLFIAGCGRFFEGTPDQMYSALVEKLGVLPPETLVFCGHEYTVNNLKFALHVEPNNTVMSDKLGWAQDQRSKRLPTIPSSIGEEKEINPFMRCVRPAIQTSVQTKSGVECMGKLRSMKDSFKAN